MEGRVERLGNSENGRVHTSRCKPSGVCVFFNLNVEVCWHDWWYYFSRRKVMFYVY